MIKIEELNEENLSEASKLADSIFTSELIPPSESFEASLDYKKFHILNSKIKGDLASLKYWVAVDGDTNQILGTTGLYEKAQDKDDTAWLGWYCVAPDARGKKVGSELLDHTIQQAKNLNKKFLRLYTSTLPSEAVAQKVYQRKGFKIMKNMGREKKDGYEIFYRQLELR